MKIRFELVLIKDKNIVYWFSISDKFDRMLMKVGLYDAIFNPTHININNAGDLISSLKSGINRLIDNPIYFKNYNPQNEWESYDFIIEKLTEYMNACILYPEYEILINKNIDYSCFKNAFGVKKTLPKTNTKYNDYNKKIKDKYGYKCILCGYEKTPISNRDLCIKYISEYDSKVILCKSCIAKIRHNYKKTMSDIINILSWRIIYT